MSIIPSKKQWNSWSLPSKLTAIGALVGVLSFGLYFVEKSFDILSHFSVQEILPKLAIGMEFPYEKSGSKIIQNKRNPRLTISNSSSVTYTTIALDVTMFVLSPNLETVNSAALLNFKTHRHLVFEPEFKPGKSIEASLPGVEKWSRPVAYDVKIEAVRGEKMLPKLSILFLVNENSIKGEFSGLSKDLSKRIKKAIDAFWNSGQPKKTLDMTAPIDNVWVPHAGPNTDILINDDGTITIK